MAAVPLMYESAGDSDDAASYSTQKNNYTASTLSGESENEELQRNTNVHNNDSEEYVTNASEQREDHDEWPQTSVRPSEHMNAVAHHYNVLQEKGRGERTKSRIFYMRNFNNWIKSQLINEYLNKDLHRYGEQIRVLDMCCGKGGDLLKWEKANINHLICTDIAEISIEQCKTRFEDLSRRAQKVNYGKKFTAEFFACDSTLVRLRERYQDPSLKLNLVSCQFALHYSFESFTQADCMVRNAAECLAPGGYFIATIPDAYEIMRRVRQSPNKRSFGNDIYNIEFVGDTDEPSLFGAKYQFHLEGVVDCPEFLVYFPLLEKVCRKHGLKLERKTSFADYYKENAEKGRTLLNRMSGLETVIPNRIKNNEEYAHINATTLKGGNPSRSFGTLTKSEWEAITLYLVCTFKKCKNTWDKDGKPVFEFDDEPK